MAKSFPNTGATVIDSSADLPTASAALEGILMFQKDTNELKICDGASWISMLDTDTPNGMVLIKSQSYSAQTTSLTQDSVFSTAYANYRIYINGYGSAAPAANFNFRIGGVDQGGTSYHQQNLTSDGSTTTSFRSISNASIGNLALNTSTIGSIIIDVTSPMDSSVPTLVQINAQDRAFSSVFGTIIWGGYNVNSAVDGFKFYWASGTFTGNVRIYGLRNTI